MYFVVGVVVVVAVVHVAAVDIVYIDVLPFWWERPLLLSQQLFLLAFSSSVMPSACASERVPTKEETDEREMQERRLMLLNKDRRAEELAKLEAQEVERERERAVAEHPRRRHAATGIYRCLLELKQPVKAAAAARARLDMCESKEELRQVGVGRLARAVYSSQDIS